MRRKVACSEGVIIADIDGISVEWLGHDTFRIEHAGVKIYIDPIRIAAEDRADFILITHDHFDHCEPSSVGKLKGPNTMVIAPFGCMVKLGGFSEISQGQTIKEKGIVIEAVAAYNIGKPYHPRGIGVGYVITIGGKRIYHAGDTDRIPEMKKIRNIDIALLPISGTYVMNVHEAAAAANEDIQPRVAIPMHYGTLSGNSTDADTFSRACSCKVVLL